MAQANEENIDDKTIQKEFQQLQRQYDQDKREMAVVQVGRLYDSKIPRKAITRSIKPIRQKRDSQTGYFEFNMSNNAVDLVHEFLEGQIHLILEATCHLLSLSGHQKKMKKQHLEALEKVMIFRLPWIERNKYQKGSVYQRDAAIETARLGTSKLLAEYETRKNTVLDMSGKWQVNFKDMKWSRGYSIDNETKWPEAHHRKRKYLLKHYRLEKEAKEKLKQSKDKLNNFQLINSSRLQGMAMDVDESEDIQNLEDVGDVNQEIGNSEMKTEEDTAVDGDMQGNDESGAESMDAEYLQKVEQMSCSDGTSVNGDPETISQTSHASKSSQMECDAAEKSRKCTELEIITAEFGLDQSDSNDSQSGDDAEDECIFPW